MQPSLCWEGAYGAAPKGSDQGMPTMENKFSPMKCRKLSKAGEKKVKEGEDKGRQFKKEGKSIREKKY